LFNGLAFGIAGNQAKSYVMELWKCRNNDSKYKN